MKPMIFTIVGRDKPGLLDSLAQTVFDMQGNWLSSNFSHMAGHFAGFVEINLPEENHQELLETFSAHRDLRIHVLAGDDTPAKDEVVAQIQIMGNDKPGIVQELSSVLYQFNINIVKFSSSCSSAPNWGSPMFTANATISMAADFDVEPLRDALEDIANDLMVDIDLQ